MKSYLDKLIQRHQASHASIRPRPVARFEPTAPQMAPEYFWGDYGDADSGIDKAADPAKPYVGVDALQTIAIHLENSTPRNVSQLHVTKPAETRATVNRHLGPATEHHRAVPSETPLDTGVQVRPASIRKLSESALPPKNTNPKSGPTSQTQEPDINITIGRVEVRAVIPRAPNPMVQQKRTAPSMSLENYLKKREA